MYTPLLGASETAFYLSGTCKILIKDTLDNFDNTCKKCFSYLEELSQKSKKFTNVDVNPPSPINPFYNK